MPLRVCEDTFLDKATSFSENHRHLRSLYFSLFRSPLLCIYFSRFSQTLSLFPGEKWMDSLCSLCKMGLAKSKSQVHLAISLFPPSYHFSSVFKVNRRLRCRKFNAKSRKQQQRERRRDKSISYLMWSYTFQSFFLISFFIRMK